MYGIPAAYVRDAGIASYLASEAKAQSDALSAAAGGGEDDDLSVSPYPSILAEFNYYMGPGGVDSETTGAASVLYDSKKCLGWRDANGDWSPRCAPLGGNSVWAAAGSPVPLDVGDGGGGGDDGGGRRPAVLVATSIDSTSMFHDLSPGANNAASNALALLAAAQLVGSHIGDDALDALHGRIVFAFFQGESYGYLGSRRFLKDVVVSDDDGGGGGGGLAWRGGG
jgi:nicastrin